MHYEIEQTGGGREHGPDVGTHTEPERWHVVNVFNADAAAVEGQLFWPVVTVVHGSAGRTH